jgi:ABC-type polysaccharide/polyol phosphate export permease
MTRRSWRDHALVQLTLFRVYDFIREPEAIFWVLAFPAILAAGLGVAFRGEEARPVGVAVVSTELSEVIKREPLLAVEEMSAAAARDALAKGQVVLVAERGADGGVLFRFDDTNPEGRAARALADRAVQIAAGRTDPVTATDDVAREPGTRYIDFLVPGLVGMGIMGNAIWGLGFAIVDARRRKLMKRIIATPMPKHYYLLSHLVWRMLLLVVEVGIPVLVGVYGFGVPIRGPIVELAAISVFGSLAFSSIGLLVACRARTIEAVSGLTNLVMLPMWVLSGVFFSAKRFPDAVQPFISALPLTALNDALRASMLQGARLWDLGPELATLAAWLVVCFLLALKLFRWK